MLKSEIIARLNEAGVEHDPAARKAALEALLAPLRTGPPPEDTEPQEPPEPLAPPKPPEPPPGMVLVYRDTVEGTGRDFRLISEEKYEAKPGTYRLYADD